MISPAMALRLTGFDRGRGETCIPAQNSRCVWNTLPPLSRLIRGIPACATRSTPVASANQIL